MIHIFIFLLILGKEQWLGLDNIYDLTNQPGKKFKLRVEMEKFSREKAVAYYDDFYLEDRVYILEYHFNLWFPTRVFPNPRIQILVLF